MKIRFGLTIVSAISLMAVACDGGTDGEAGTGTDDASVDAGIDDAGSGGPLCNLEFCDQVLIPAGEFPMGADSGPECDSMRDLWGCGDARPVHWVSLGAFYIDKYEVTYERYDACVRAGVCSPAGLEWEPPVNKLRSEDGLVVNEYPPECRGHEEDCPYHAINAKTWEQAHTYCRWIDRRLCTEAEWERAANGPGQEQRLYPWGDDPLDGSLANISGTINVVDDHPAGQSAEGVFNLTGNVMEWVEDYYGLYSSAPSDAPLVDPTGPASGDRRITRGGCILFSKLNTSRDLEDPAFDWG